MLKWTVSILLLSLAFSWLWPDPSSAETLVTEAESRLPKDLDGGMGWRGITRGPGIEQAAPPADQPITSPFVLQIRFHSRNAVEVDADSTKLTYLTLPPVDLTGRIRNHVSPAGIEITQAEAPPGLHVLRVDVRDRQGRASGVVIKFTVTEK